MTNVQRKLIQKYAMPNVLARIKRYLSEPHIKLTEKIIPLFDPNENRANIAVIYDNLFSLIDVQSMNTTLRRYREDFNNAATQSGENVICYISEGRKGGTKNRWIWFEGEIPTMPEAMTTDLQSVSSFQNSRAINLNAKPVIVVVHFNENEFTAACEVFSQNGNDIQVQNVNNHIVFDVGVIGNFEVKLLYFSNQGYIAGYQVATSVYQSFQPYAILPVGIGYGSIDGLNIGDVLVPQFVTDANNTRELSDGKVIPNGASEYRVSSSLYKKLFDIDKIKTRAKDYDWPHIHAWGGLISKSAHVNHLEQRESLKRVFNMNAMGGEMELAGFGAAAYELDNAFLWLPIKGVSDAGDGNVDTENKQVNQYLASKNAAIVAKALIESLPCSSDETDNRIDNNRRCKSPPRRVSDDSHWEKRFQLSSANPISLESELLNRDTHTALSYRETCVVLQDELMKWVKDHNAPPIFALLGENGMGKTVNCQKFADTLFQQNLSDNTKPSSLYFDLRYVTILKNGVPTLDSMMIECAKKGWINGIDIDIKDIFDRIELNDVVVFDGLDEVLVKLNEQECSTFVRTLLSVIDIAKNRGVKSPKVLVSTRTQFFRNIREQNSLLTGHDRADKRADSILAMLIQPFTNEQIRSYLSCAVVSSDLDGIMSTLDSIYDLKSLAERPYTLWLVSELMPTIQKWIQTGETISTAKLYHEITQRWLERDNTKHFLIPEHKRELSKDLAAFLWKNKSSTIPIEQLENWCIEWLNDQPLLRSRYIFSRDDNDKLLEDLRNTTYLTRSMHESEDGLFRFSHTSLQEYFLALRLYDALREDRYEDWDLPLLNSETLSFLGQMIQEDHSPGKLLSTLSQWAKKDRIAANTNLLEYALFAKRSALPLPSLRCINLSRAILNNKNITCDLPEAKLIGASLRDAEITDVNLSRADLSDADLTRAKLYRCNLTSLNISNAKMSGTIIYQSDAPVIGAPITYRTQWLWNRNLPASVVSNSNSFVTDQKQNPTSPQRLCSFTPQSSSIFSIAWSPDGTSFVSGGSDQDLRLWDAVTGECRSILKGHSSGVRALAWSPDGTYFVSGGEDQDLRLWDAATGECRSILKGHSSGVWALAWSPDGTSFVSGGYDNSVRLWDAETLQSWSINILSGDDYAVFNQDHSIRFASEMAWQYLGWQTMIDGKIDRLPAEIYGKLPSVEDYKKEKSL